MSDLDDEVAQLLDEAVARLSTARRTFTDEEALRPIWERGYDFSPQSDPQGRFALAAEADGKARQIDQRWRRDRASRVGLGPARANRCPADRWLSQH